jgi:AcrR family transcriptional regulator
MVAAAQVVFAEKGFAAARLEDIAARAGVSKGALYLYFDNKTELFRAVVRDSVAPAIAPIAAAIEASQTPLGVMLTQMMQRIPAMARAAGAAAVAKIVIAESRNFPDLPRVWHDAVVSKVLGALTLAIARAQAKGDARPGDPRLYAAQIMAPLLMAILWSEVFEPVGAEPLPLGALARQSVRTLLRGLLTDEAFAAMDREATA